jgi:hypothetical protein
MRHQRRGRLNRQIPKIRSASPSGKGKSGVRTIKKNAKTPKMRIGDAPPNPIATKRPHSFVQQSNAVFVVGGGPSLRGFDFSVLTHFDTIAINSAVFDVPNPRYFITMDYTYIRKMKGKLPIFKSMLDVSKIFVVSYNGNVNDRDGRIIDTKFHITYNLSLFDIIIKSRCIDGIGFTMNDFRTGRNSGFCGLQLAVLLGYKNIFLLGMDLKILNNKTHYHTMYEGHRMFDASLEKYYQAFKVGLAELAIYRPDVSVISCSPTSRLNDFIKFRDIDRVFDARTNKN